MLVTMAKRTGSKLLGGPDHSSADLERIAEEARAHVIRTVAAAGAGHIGGPLSAIDILTCLYFRVLRIDPDRPEWPDRDRFILSKGHSAIGLYAVLALRGYFPVGELATFDQLNSRLQGHPDMTVTPGVDMSSGSLGLGFSGAVGIALGAQLAGREFRTYVMLGDGECNEGVVWEGAHVASRYGLGNLTAVIDFNRLQQYGWPGMGTSRRRAPYEASELVERWRAFGWNVKEVDGHDMTAIVGALETTGLPGVPTVLLAHTVKGRGVSFMEDDFTWHARVPTDHETGLAVAELESASTARLS
jgi:transketolase